MLSDPFWFTAAACPRPVVFDVKIPGAALATDFEVPLPWSGDGIRGQLNTTATAGIGFRTQGQNVDLIGKADLSETEAERVRVLLDATGARAFRWAKATTPIPSTWTPARWATSRGHGASTRSRPP